MMSYKNLLGMVISIMAYGLAWWLYDWKLAVVIFLAITGNNLERSGRRR